MSNVDAGNHGQQECCSTVLLQEPRRDTHEVFKDRCSSVAISVPPLDAAKLYILKLSLFYDTQSK